jgi:beta-lactamase regulating signal transducer with metallopeptidase domain
VSPFAETLVAALVRSSLQGAVFIGLVWIVCRLFPRLPASVRCGLWWAACLKLLVGLVWISPVELPLLPAAETRTVHVSHLSGSPSSSMVNVVGEGTSTDSEFSKTYADPQTALVALWLAGLLALSVKAARQLRHTRWVIRRSEPLNEGWIRTAFAELCERLSLRRAPGLLGSDDVRTPQAIGLVRPLVVLPRPGLEKLSPPEVSMTLCHELLHLRRGDLWLGWVPALAHRIFFFHPLAAMAAREYAIAREAACDAEVIQILGSAPQAYGRLLLRWGVAPRETGLAAAGASPSLQNLKRRLQMLQQSNVDNHRNKRGVSGWWWLAGVAVLAGLVPLRIVAQEPAPEAEIAEPAEIAETAETAETAAAPEAPEAPEAVVAPEAVPTPEVAPAPRALPAPVVAPVPPSPSVAAPAPKALPTPRPVASAAPLPPAAAMAAPPADTPRPAPAPRAPLPSRSAPPALAPAPVARVASAIPAVAPAPAPRAHSSSRETPPPPPPPAPPAPPKPPAPPRNGYSYHSGGHNGDSWMLLTGDSSVMMSGDLDDLEKVKRMRGSSKEDILWFRHNGKAYIVRDAATLKQAKELFRPQMELGAKQGALGARQGELGGRQGALGAKQGALGAELGAIAADRARRGDDADDRDLERRENEIQRKMEELSRQQEELGRQQEGLGRQQEELGRQQEELSRRIERDFKVLMARTIESGVAQEVR